MPAQISPKSNDSLPIWSARFDPQADPSGFGFASEWVLADGLGGFAMGTISGLAMRRYHGLLCAALSPPVRRAMVLGALDECIHIPAGGTCGCDLDVHLTGFQFADQDPPIEHPYLRSFVKEADTCRWIYSIPTQRGPVHVCKSLTIADGLGGIRVEYEIESAIAPDDASGKPNATDITLEIRPLVAMRDFHALNTPGTLTPDDFACEQIFEPAVAGVAITRKNFEPTLSIRGIQIGFIPTPSIWKGITYEREIQRHQDDTEDLMCPGVFTATIATNEHTTVSIEATISPHPATDWNSRSEAKRTRLRSSIDYALHAAGDPTDPILREAIAKLAIAGDDFIVERMIGSSASTSIIAGYPWFSDWGRDTMIAIPGLLLTTGRFDEAHQTLSTFAGAIDHGLIPNRFDDAGGASHYNTVDASLWFVHACAQWANATEKTLDRHLIDACDTIIDAYIAGTIHHIGLDESDGLIFAGDANTQLTWMDALRDGVAFTPRFGKAIEINALWINALEARQKFDDTRPYLGKMAAQARSSMIATMSNGPGGGLVDCLFRSPGVRTTDWSRSDELRPNQLFAAALQGVGLPDGVARASFEAVASTLATPVGVRTLDPANPNYCPHYAGSMTDRDRAYHNGTAWPWLLGPYCEAMLRVNHFDADARKRAQAIMLGLVEKMESDSVGQLFEIYDAEPDADGQHCPQGCPAQAWSISEALRVLVLSCR
jgi:predicted glycogen debranching enzyme